MIEPVFSKEQVLEAVVSNPKFYNNIQNVQTPRIDPIHTSNDADLLAQIGYKQEFQRKFNAIQVFGVAFSIMGLLPSIASIIMTGLTAGPAGMIWGWVVAVGFIMTIGIAMSENASFQPTSGGLYYWTNFYAPAKWKTVLSYVIGNTNTMALVAGLCSINYGYATQILSIVVIAKDGDFELTPARTYGVFVASVMLHIAITSASSKHIAWLQSASIVVNVTLILLFLIAMPIAASRGTPRPASWIFGNFEGISGFPIGWVQVSQAWLPAIWTNGGFDACVHMAEECIDPSRTIPFGIVTSIGVCGTIGFALLVVTMFSIQTYDIENHILGSKFGQPMAQIIFDAFDTVPGQGKKMAIFFMVLISIGQFMIGASVLTAISRQIFAFARDDGLPMSWWIKHVNTRLKVPIHAVITGGVLSILLGLLCLIGTTASNALFTLVIAGNYLAWNTPTFFRLIYMKEKFVPGRFFLGQFWSRVNGWISVTYGLFVVIMVMFPTDPNPNKETMNYTVVVAAAVGILSLVYYCVYGKKYYHGPATNLEVPDSASEEVMRIADVLENKNGES